MVMKRERTVGMQKQSLLPYAPPINKRPCNKETPCLREVTNTVTHPRVSAVHLEALVNECRRLSFSWAPQSLHRRPDEVELKLLSVLEGHFEAPGFSDSRRFRQASRRQKIVASSRQGSSDADVVYEAAWCGASPTKTSACDYTKTVLDWEALSGEVFHIRWWSRDMRQYCRWDRDLRFWTYEELQEAHQETLPGTTGPLYNEWCLLSEDDETTMDWNMFWSAALLFRVAGSSGVKSWDRQFRAMQQQLCCHHQ